MNSSIDIQGNLQDEIRKLLLSYLNAIELNTNFNSTYVEESVHNIRKTIKKIRAVLRLTRDEIGYSSYLREDNFYRDIGRKLSEFRDLDVYLSVALDLEQRFIRELNYSCLTYLVSQIKQEKAACLNQIIKPKGFSSELTQKLAIGRLNSEKITIADNSYRFVLEGLKRSYKKGRKTLQICINDSTPEKVHQLRKALKNIWYQIRIIRPVYPVFLKAYAKSLRSITRMLGKINDYAQFKVYLNNSTARGLNRTNRNIINEMLDSMQKEKLVSSLPKIQLALIEKPSVFIKRIYGYWDVTNNKSSHTDSQPEYDKM